jgi:hypothetical protein
VKHPSQFLRYLTVREGYDFAEPYGFYFVPVNEFLALACFFSAGESIDEEGWQHLSVTVRYCPANYRKKEMRSDPWAWVTRLPTGAEIALARSIFFLADEWVIQFHPPADLLDPPGVVPEQIIHLWARKDWESQVQIPPPFLLSCFKRKV